MFFKVLIIWRILLSCQELTGFLGITKLPTQNNIKVKICDKIFTFIHLDGTTYFYQTFLYGEKIGNGTETGNCVKIDLSKIVKGENNGQLAYQFSLKRNNKMSKTVTAHLQFDVSKELFELIGIERED